MEARLVGRVVRRRGGPPRSGLRKAPRSGGGRGMMGPMIIEAVHGDITCQSTDAIVNAANSGLLGV